MKKQKEFNIFNINAILTGLIILSIGMAFGTIFEEFGEIELVVSFALMFIAGMFLGLKWDKMVSDIYNRIVKANERRSK